MMSPTPARRARLAAALAVGLLALSACGGAGSDQTSTSPAPQLEDSASTEPAGGHDEHTGVKPVKAKPLRPGERRTTIEMPESYTPSAPYGAGTDDYRCFLLDPELEKDTWLTGTHVRPGNSDVVHHVILFQVPPKQVKAAEAKDAADEGQGWTCFGGTGLEQFQNVDDAAWVGAWAPGGQESVTKPGLGTKLAKGSRIVMQVHYNLLAGAAPDTSAAMLRTAPGSRDYQALTTMLLPAPVELPCRANRADGPLCDRADALADVKKRFGVEGNTADILYFLCGGKPRAGEVQSCTRPIGKAMTIHGVAAHMHLLGREIRIEVNPGTAKARTILDIPVWDFDNQGATPIKPITLQPFETVRVTCRHVQWLRDDQSAFETAREDRYVVWGEGSTDEMCLGMLQVTRP